MTMDIDDLILLCQYAFSIGFCTAFGALFCLALLDFLKRVIGSRR